MCERDGHDNCKEERRTDGSDLQRGGCDWRRDVHVVRATADAAGRCCGGVTRRGAVLRVACCWYVSFRTQLCRECVR